MELEKILIIVQARTSSTRFPNKVLSKINGKSLIEILITRLKKIKIKNQIILATTKKKSDDSLYKLSKKLNILCFRGSEENVLNRFYLAANKYKGKIIVRITGDCPLSDPELIEKIIKFHSLSDLLKKLKIILNLHAIEILQLFQMD